jgi:hypothetical protein
MRATTHRSGSALRRGGATDALRLGGQADRLRALPGTRDDAALDEALERIAELSTRLHAVRDLHEPRRTLLGACVCRACARTFPCPTARLSR